MATLTIEHPERIWQLRLIMLLLIVAGAAVWFVLQQKTAESAPGTDSQKQTQTEVSKLDR